LLGTPCSVGVGLRAAQPVIDVQRRHAIAELAERVVEARRVGAARGEAEHGAARLDQLVAPDVLLDAFENAQAVIQAPGDELRGAPRSRGLATAPPTARTRTSGSVSKQHAPVLEHLLHPDLLVQPDRSTVLAADEQ